MVAAVDDKWIICGDSVAPAFSTGLLFPPWRDTVFLGSKEIQATTMVCDLPKCNCTWPDISVLPKFQGRGEEIRQEKKKKKKEAKGSFWGNNDRKMIEKHWLSIA